MFERMRVSSENSAKNVEKVVACEDEAVEVVEGAVAEVVDLLVVSTWTWRSFECFLWQKLILSRDKRRTYQRVPEITLSTVFH